MPSICGSAEGVTHDEIVVAEAARLHLIGRSQQVHVNLEAAPQIAAGGVARVGVHLQHGAGDGLVILRDHLVVERLGALPGFRQIGFPVERRQQRATGLRSDVASGGRTMSGSR